MHLGGEDEQVLEKFLRGSELQLSLRENLNQSLDSHQYN